MTDARVYKCDATNCSFNYGQTCSAPQIELNEKRECTTFREDDCFGCKAECTPSWKEACDLQFSILKNRDGFYLEDKPQNTYGFGKATKV